MNKIERVNAVIARQQPDRLPISFWYHFGPDAISGPKAVEAHVRHMEKYDLDFLKIMDDNRYPRTATRSEVITSAEDLEKIQILHGDEDSFGRQLELISQLHKRFGGQVRMITTVFNSWSTLRQLTMPDTGQHGSPSETPNPRDQIMSRLLREAPLEFARVLDAISESLTNFVGHALAAGADGVFFSVRDDWVDTPENGEGTYERLVRPGDDGIMEAADEGGGSLNVVYVCGKALDFARFANYRVHVINWADRQAGPSIAEGAGRPGPAICAGLDHLDTMVTGSPDDCVRQMADAVRHAAGRPIMLAPDCTFDPSAVPEENLRAIREGAESLTYDL